MRRFIKEENKQDNSKWARTVADYIVAAAEDEYVDSDAPTELYDDIDPEDCPAGIGIHYIAAAQAPYRRSNDPSEGNYNIRPEEYNYMVQEASVWAGEDCEDEYDVTDDVQKILDDMGKKSGRGHNMRSLNRKRDLAESSLAKIATSKR